MSVLIRSQSIEKAKAMFLGTPTGAQNRFRSLNFQRNNFACNNLCCEFRLSHTAGKPRQQCKSSFVGSSLPVRSMFQFLLLCQDDHENVIIQAFRRERQRMRRSGLSFFVKAINSSMPRLACLVEVAKLGHRRQLLQRSEDIIIKGLFCTHAMWTAGRVLI